MPVLVIIFVFLLLIGMPIVFMLGIVGVVHIIILGNPSFNTVIIQRLFSGVNQFSLLAIPFFVLAGELMNKGGITEKLVQLSRECVGHFKGGLAYTVVIVSMLLSAILGSANAVAAILSSMMVPEMQKDGYEDSFSASLIASSGIIGPIIPPSITFIIYGVMTGTSISSLFLAGFVPGIMLGISYIIIIRLYSVRKQFPKSIESFDLINVMKSFFYSIPAMLTPLVIVGGVLTGIFTPTEAGAVAVMIAFFTGFFIYKTLKISELPGMILRASIVTSGIMLIVAFGNILGWTLAIEQIPMKLTAAITGFTQNKYLILLLIIILLLAVGCVMEAFATQIIFTPVLFPLALSIGLDPVHFGIIFSVLISIALITPPVGMCLFVTSNVTGVPLSSLSKSIWPFVISSFVVLFTISYLPGIVMFLPNLFGK